VRSRSSEHDFRFRRVGAGKRPRIRSLLSSLHAVVAILCLVAAPAAFPAESVEHDMIGVVINLRIGEYDTDWQEWFADPGVPFTIESGDGAGRWTITATARPGKDGTFVLDATVRCGSHVARRAHMRTAGKENLAMLAAQSSSCPAARRTLAAEMRLHNTRGMDPGENITPSRRLRFKVCWDDEGKPTTLTFLSADPPEFAASAEQIAQSVRTWTFHNEHGPSGPGCDIVPVIVN